MTLKLKHSARIIGVRSETLLGVMIVNSVFNSHGLDCIMTSGIDSTHGDGSIHYSGGAVDFRIRNIPETLLMTIRDECKEALGGDFDFILEKNHYHMEFQPKRPY